MLNMSLQLQVVCLGSLTQTWKIALLSLSGCIVQSNFRCASCVLQHLLLHHVKHATSFHPRVLKRFHTFPTIVCECLIRYLIIYTYCNWKVFKIMVAQFITHNDLTHVYRLSGKGQCLLMAFTVTDLTVLNVSGSPSLVSFLIYLDFE